MGSSPTLIRPKNVWGKIPFKTTSVVCLTSTPKLSHELAASTPSFMISLLDPCNFYVLISITCKLKIKLLRDLTRKQAFRNLDQKPVFNPAALAPSARQSLLLRMRLCNGFSFKAGAKAWHHSVVRFAGSSASEFFKGELCPWLWILNLQRTSQWQTRTKGNNNAVLSSPYVSIPHSHLVLLN